MRFDPTAVFFHTIFSLPLRALLAWIAGSLGAFTPSFIGFGFWAFEGAGWLFMLFPIHLVLMVLFSGWWGFVAFLLLIAFGVRVFMFIRDGMTTDLFWLFMLPFLIGIRGSMEAWPIAALLAGICILIVVILQRRQAGRPLLPGWPRD